MRHRHLTRWALVAAAALIVAAGVLPTIALQSDSPSADVVAVVPPEAKARVNPVDADDFSTKNGGALFASQCAMCHGALGTGDGKLAERLALPMPDFSTKAQQKNRTDGELFYIVTKGHGRMPGDGERLSENARWDLINFIRTLDDAR